MPLTAKLFGLPWALEVMVSVWFTVPVIVGLNMKLMTQLCPEVTGVLTAHVVLLASVVNGAVMPPRLELVRSLGRLLVIVTPFVGPVRGACRSTTLPFAEEGSVTSVTAGS